MSYSDLQKIYKDNAVFLNDNLLLTPRFLAYFQKDDVLPNEIKQDIEIAAPTKKVSMFINVMMKRDKTGFKRLIEALDNTGQKEIADELDPERESKPESWEIAALVSSRATHFAKKTDQIPIPGPLERSGTNADAYPPTDDTSVQQVRDPGSNEPRNWDTKDVDIKVEIVTVDKAEAEKILRNEACYPMKSKCRGRAIVVNMQKFGCDADKETKAKIPKGLTYRTGSDVDAHNLLRLYTRLGFTAVKWDNLTKCELLTKLEEERKHKDHEEADAFILTILSHGNEGSVYCSDGLELEIKTLYAFFDGKGCSPLADKPKIFFIQACQGNNSTIGVKVPDDEAMKGDNPCQGISSDFCIESDRREHERAHFVKAISTVPGYVSYRHTILGSYFIRALIHTFMEQCHIHHLGDMLDEVNAKLDESLNTEKQIGERTLSTNRKIYFLPGYP